MKILYLSRLDLFSVRGGDTLQMEKTKAAIEKIDHTVQIDISNEIEPKNIGDYDIVHLFNLDWLSETYIQAQLAKKHNKKIVLSAIHHSEDEVKKYETMAAYDIRRVYNYLFKSQPQRDVWKNLYRSMMIPAKLKPSLLQYQMGIRNQQREILKMSDIVLVQTEAEAESIKKDFDFADFKYAKVVNGVDPSVFGTVTNEEFIHYVKQHKGVDLKDKKIILNVGRIEPRKNQLKIIEVFESLKEEYPEFKEWEMVFIGDLSNKSFEYKIRFNQELKKHKDVIHITGQPQKFIASAMAHHGIYVHTSWFETTALVCLEALLSGMQVVTTSHRLKEYVGDSVEYCLPDNVESIKNAILTSRAKPKNMLSIQENIKKNYTWENAAEQTLAVYRSL